MDRIWIWFSSFFTGKQAYAPFSDFPYFWQDIRLFRFQKESMYIVASISDGGNQYSGYIFWKGIKDLFYFEEVAYGYEQYASSLFFF